MKPIDARKHRLHSKFLCTALVLTCGVILSAQTIPAQTVKLDPTFAPILQDFGETQNRAAAHVSALQPDGKILVGGIFTVASGLARSGVARINPDGTPDPTFDAGNIGVAETLLSVTTGGTIRAIKVQADGKILIGGSYRRENETFGRTIERLNGDGSIDTTFQASIFSASIVDLEIQSDGKVVVGGNFQIAATNPANGQSVTFKHLARLNADGSFDFSFTGNGLQDSNNIVIQPDGKIVVGNASTGATPIQLIRYNTNGTIDVVLADLDDWIEGLELQPDGKLVVVGWFRYVNGAFQRRVARINPNGTLDAPFAPTTGFMDGIVVWDVALAPEGKIVVGGDFSSFNSETRWRVARINSDGSLDTTFTAATPIAGIVNDVLVLPDSKVFIGGAFPLDDGAVFYNNIARLNSDGLVDTSFNRANVIFEGEGYSIVQQPDGKVLVGGFIYYANDVKRRALARYNADGTLDAGFIPFQSLSYILDIALQTDGKILVVNADSPSTLYRLNADGSQDIAFTAPFVPFSAYIQKRTRITSIVVQPAGEILVAGQLITGSATSPTLSGLVRLNPNGALDPTFQIVRALGGTRDVHDIALQPDGRIVIGGDFSHINNNSSFRYLARINSDGTIDTSYMPPPPPSPIAVIYEIELQPDGKVVYAGNFDFVLRVNANGTPDSPFNIPVNNQVEALTVQPNGKVLVGGYFTSINNVARNRIARLNPDGSVDTGFDIPSGANNIVYDFSLQNDGRVLVAGAFTKLGTLERLGAARLIESKTRFDFDGDGKADISVYRPSSGTWYLNNSMQGFTAMQFGIGTDTVASSDYDGDGKTDIAVFRDGSWYILQTADNGMRGVQFGMSGDLPVPADYDGDGKADIAVFRPSNGVWYRVNSSNNQFVAVQFGVSGDKPQVGDFDGDGKNDLAVFRPAGGAWFVLRSSDSSFYGLYFGLQSDVPTAADYDGDGKTDVSVFRPTDGNWYRINSSDNSFTAVAFGTDSDRPVPADYDGDGKADIAVYRDGIWYLQRSAAGYLGVQFGLPDDAPIPFAGLGF